MHFRSRTAGFAVAFVAAAALLTAPSARSADEKSHQDSWDSNTRVVMGTVLEKSSGEVKVKTDSGELRIITFDEPGLTVKIDKSIVKGSRVKVTELVTSQSRTLTIEPAPAN